MCACVWGGGGVTLRMSFQSYSTKEGMHHPFRALSKITLTRHPTECKEPHFHIWCREFTSSERTNFTLLQ